MRLSDHRYSRDLRRYQVASQMVAHAVRTGTICDWTGLTQDRIRRLSRSYGSVATGAAVRRPRGAAPKSPETLLRTKQLRVETAALAGAMKLLGIIDETGGVAARVRSARLEFAEQICRAYSMFREVAPHAEISLEQALLVLRQLGPGGTLALESCRACSALMAIDRLAAPQPLCVVCEESERRAPGTLRPGQ
jgi:hypothetical protein